MKFALATAAVAASTSVGPYPGYSGPLKVTGEVNAYLSKTGNAYVTYTLKGLEDACKTTPEGVANACGIHIHEGKTCDDADAVGGHYYDMGTVSSDPWAPVSYVTRFGGFAYGSGKATIGKGEDIAGRAIVVHDSTGARVGCSLIPSTLSLMVEDTCSLFQIADDTCGQSDLNCDYVKYAKAAEKGLQDGTCADQGYTVETGTQTKSYPVIGDIKITTYTKGSSLASAGTGPALVTFDGAADTTFKFTALNDPVMGGKSTGTWTLGNGFGTLDGEVVDVPSLSAPGFIKAAADGKFPDISSAFGGNLVLTVRTSTPEYAGYRVTFVSGATSGSFACAAGGSLPFSRGCFKAKFSVPAGDNFGQIKIPFTDFSDKWSSATGEQTTTCAESADVCPTASKLSKITRVEFWGEGANGKLHLDVQSVMAEDASGNLIQMV